MISPQPNGFLSCSGFIVSESTLKAIFGNRLNQFYNKLTITTPQKIGPPKIATCYENITVGNKSCVRLPRTSINNFANTIKINNLLPQLQPRDIKITLDIHDDQLILINYMMEKVFTTARINAGTAACILNLKPGYGKTFVAAGMIAKLQLKTLYVVLNSNLESQALRDLKICFENSKKIVKFGKNIDDADVVVIIINSALNQPKEFFAKFSFIIYDEVHAYCSKKRSKIFANIVVCAMGMSGTTENRSDKFDVIAHRELAFDGVIRAENVPGFEYQTITFAGVANVINYHGPVEHTKNLTHKATNRTFVHYMYNQFIEDDYRNNIIIDKLIDVYDWRGPDDQRHNIYIFAEEVEILKKSRRIFVEKLLARNRGDINIVSPEIDTSLFVGGMTNDEINTAVSSARVLFGTYGFGGTGTSITKMTAMFFVTPRRAGMLQIVPRILRRGSDITIPRIIYDVVDKKTALRGQLGDRLVAYSTYGFDIRHEKIVAPK